ncbi:MAG: AAA family ATPase [Candidatus Caccosoma sp.]|nr:AAA family ATPase [Candidatus Caccosoma sp.]
MKLLRIIANGLPLFKDKIDLCFLATQRVNDKQKKSLYHLFSNVYLNFTNGFIGINASGKTSILKVILLCLKIVNNEPINHIECKSILGEAKSVTFNIYFYSNKANEICLLKTTIVANKKNFSEIEYSIENEELYSKKSSEFKIKKSLFDFTKYDQCLIRNTNEEFLPSDVSIIISRNKKFKENIHIVDMLKFTNENILPTTKNISLDIISFLDPTIEKLHFDEKGNNTLIHLKFKEKEEIILNNINELNNYLSSGTIKGIIAFQLVSDILKDGGYFIIDEIENHFNKEIIVTLLRLFMDGKLNKNGGIIIYSTHYPELLDEYERNDSLFITRNMNGIAIDNLSNILKRNDIKKSDAYESGLMEGTTPSYEAYMKLKKHISSSIGD